MRMQLFIASTFSVCLMVLGQTMAVGQDYPNKPIRIVTSLPGGSSDFVARVIAQGIPGPLGQPVIVDNRGSGFIQGTILSKATPDGYTLLVAPGSFWIAPFFQKAPYDPVKDFSPVTLAATAPNVLVVPSSLPVTSVKELIDLAKAKPGVLNYGSSAAGAPNHLSAELFKAMAGVNIVWIPYKAGGLAVIGLLGGEVQMILDTGASLMPHIKSGKLRALAVTSAKPSALFPGLPTVAETLPGYEVVAMTAVFLPVGTPDPIIKRLNQEIVRALNQTDAKEKLLLAGQESATSSPSALAATIKVDMAKWQKIIKDAHIGAK